MSRKKVRRTNRHHRLSRSRTGGVPFNGQICGIDNVKMVDYKKHQAFHHMFPDTHPSAVASELNENWIDPNYIMIAVSKKDAKKVMRMLRQSI